MALSVNVLPLNGTPSLVKGKSVSVVGPERALELPVRCGPDSRETRKTEQIVERPGGIWYGTGVGERVLVIYLKTGGGHITAARALSQALERRPEVDKVVLFNPIGPRQRVARWAVEQGYNRMNGSLRWLWPLVYEAAMVPFVRKVGLRLFSAHVRRRVEDAILEHGITRVVNVHFLTQQPLADVRRRLRKRGWGTLKGVTVVTDPVTAHRIWFARPEFPKVVFTQRLYDHAVRRYRVDPKRIVRLPIVLRPEFESALSEDRVRAVKTELGIPADQGTVLLAGGGEGLAEGPRVLKELAASPHQFGIIVVCGHAEDFYRKARQVAERYPERAIVPFRFTDRMYELMNVADVVVTKAGPATIMEALILNKPVILMCYMYGQELGNVELVVENRLGFFRRTPRSIRAAVETIIGDPEAGRGVRENVRNMRIENGTERIVDYVLDLKHADTPADRRSNERGEPHE